MKIEKGRMTVEDTGNNLVEVQDGVKCGCENPRLRITHHIDGKDFYANCYRCDCGNNIKVSYERNESEQIY